jgi:hypothetical protein
MRSHAVHEPIGAAQIVEGFDGGQCNIYADAAHTKIILSRKWVGQGTCWIAIPLHLCCLVRTT